MTYTFIITHFGAGSSVLCNILDQNSKISALGSSGLTYDHPSKLNDLYRRWKEKSNRYIDVNHTIDKLVLNHQLRSNSFYDICNFIYMIRDPKQALASIMRHGYAEDMAAEYYAFRLRRLCEMSKHTPNAMLITYDQLLDEDVRSMKLKQIEEMLGLQSSLIYENKNEESHKEIPHNLIEKCKYNKYLKYLASNLRY